MTNDMNDTGNGERLARQCADLVRWVTDWKCFLVWDGRRWERQPDETRVEGLAKKMALSIADEARLTTDDSTRQALLKWASQTLNMGKIRAAVQALKSVPSIRIESDRLNRNAYALNTLNGTVDLRTGELRPHTPADMLTRLVPHNYVPGKYSPMWRSLLNRATKVDETGATAGFLGMALGYMLIGGNPEHRMFFLIGPGGTGKSQIVEIPTLVLGTDYAWTSKPSLITKGRSDVHTEEVAVLEHKRFISISETDGSMRLDEAMFKTVTGQSHMAMRKLYDVQRLAQIDATIIVGTNEAPMISKFDEAVKRRLVIIPSGPSLTPDEKDIGLRNKIVEHEAEGVLAGLVRGATTWYMKSQQVGLSTESSRHRAVFDVEMPPAVQIATDGFALEHDPVIQFIDERVDFSEGARTPAVTVMAEYKRFAEEAGGIGRRALFDRLLKIAEERGHRVFKDARTFHGVRIMPVMYEEVPFQPSM
jgi:putative DNA primase/helicase